MVLELILYDLGLVWSFIFTLYQLLELIDNNRRNR